MSLEQLVINAFENKSTGLTKDPILLKKKNPELKGISDAAITSILSQKLGRYNSNSSVKKTKKYVSWRADYVGDIIHADLMFIKSPRNTNQTIEVDDKKYILIMVDTYSKYIWIGLLENKNSETIAKMIHEVINSLETKYYGNTNQVSYRILTDLGKEFNSNLINNDRVKHVTTTSPYGAALAEGAINRIRTKIKYIDRNLRKMSKEDFEKIIYNLNLESDAIKIINGEKMLSLPKIIEPEKEVYKQGDYVRIKVVKEIFDKKSSLDNFSEKVFIVYDSVLDNYSNVRRYLIGSSNGYYISKRLWYKEELHKIPYNYMLTLDKKEYEKNNEFTKDEISRFQLVQDELK